MSPNHKLFVDSLDKLVTDRGDALLMEAVKALYNACFGDSLMESIYDSNGRPLTVDHSLYNVFYIKLEGRARYMTLEEYINKAKNLAAMSNEELQELLGQMRGVGMWKSNVERDYAFDIMKEQRGIAEKLSDEGDVTIIENSPTIVGTYSLFDSYGTPWVKVEYFVVKVASYVGKTKNTDPEWSMSPSMRASKRKERWDNVQNDEVYAKLYRDVREDHPETYNNFNDFRINEMTDDVLRLGREWVKEGDHFVNRWDRFKRP